MLPPNNSLSLDFHISFLNLHHECTVHHDSQALCHPVCLVSINVLTTYISIAAIIAKMKS